MEIDGKSIVVTGGAGGIGSCVIRKLLEKKAVVAAVDMDQNKLDLLKDNCESLPGKLMCYCGDIGDFSFVQTVTEDFFKKCGKIDVLINNAAILKDALLVSVFKGQVRKFSLEDWNKTIDSNLNGVFYFSREIAEKMVIKRTPGVIINVSSISSAGNSGQSAYAASKAGLNALTVTWASELASFGIRVAGIAPGIIETDMPKKAMSETIISEWVKKTPVKRMGLPEEIANGILFIVDNDFFCGRVLEIDGGLKM